MAGTDETLRNNILESAYKLNDFAKAMIPIIAGFFVAYFALLKFLGIEQVAEVSNQILKEQIAIPPILFIVSIISLTIGAKPYILFKKAPTEWHKVRNGVFLLIYVPIIISIVLFLIGLGYIIGICNIILLNQP